MGCIGDNPDDVRGILSGLSLPLEHLPAWSHRCPPHCRVFLCIGLLLNVAASQKPLQGGCSGVSSKALVQRNVGLRSGNRAAHFEAEMAQREEGLGCWQGIRGMSDGRYPSILAFNAGCTGILGGPALTCQP